MSHKDGTPDNQDHDEAYPGEDAGAADDVGAEEEGREDDEEEEEEEGEGDGFSSVGPGYGDDDLGN